jgi:ABC-type branched-subunit amino acid transport system substrate-binding protein
MKGTKDDMSRNRDSLGDQVTELAGESYSNHAEGDLSAAREENAGASEPAVISRRDFLVGSGATAVLLTGASFPVRAAKRSGPVGVGFVLPTEGPFAKDAESLIAGFDLLLAERGDAAPRLKILKRDPGPDGDKILEGVAELVMKLGVRFLVGPMGLKASEQAIHGLSGTEVIHFVTNPAVRLVGGELCVPGSFRLCPNTFQMSRPLAPWALSKIGHRVFITGSDDWLGNEVADFFAEGFERAGGSFVDRKMVNRESGGLEAVLSAIRKGKPDFVFASFHGREAAAFVKSYRQASPRLVQPILGPESLTEYPATLAGLGGFAAGIKTLSSLKDPVGLTKRVKEKLHRGISSVSCAAQGHDIAAAVCGAVESAARSAWDHGKVVETVGRMTIEGPRGTVRFDKNHEPILDLMVQEWETAGGSGFRNKVLDALGSCSSPDFGCGNLGFSRKPEQRDEDRADGSTESRD